MKLNTLYKTSSKGATQVLDMEIIGDTYTRTWGQLDGKMQSKATVAKPKNVGRSNETTAEEQAILEAEAVWVKKKKTGYSETQDAPVEILLPMKVNDYHKHKKKIQFPCFTSPKLNGVNGEYRLVDGELKLLSRGGEEYPIPAHQRVQAVKLLEALDTDSINGEMYIHGEHLQDIMSATKKHNELTPRLSFHVFDFPNVEGEYKDKCPKMYNIKEHYRDHDTSAFPFVPVWVARSHEELDDQHSQCVTAGYEGLIIRNPSAKYEYNKRSLDVFKYKVTQDGEFYVEGCDIDKNGHPVFRCAVNHEKTFKVKLKGTNEERLEMAANAGDYLGKYLKIEYEMLSKDGIPLKPVGIMFRKVDENGEAIE